MDIIDSIYEVTPIFIDLSHDNTFPVLVFAHNFL